MSLANKNIHSPSITSAFFSRVSPYLFFAFLGVLGILIYSNTWRSPFVFDDRYAIVANETIRHPWQISSIWNAFNTRFVLGLTFMMNYAIGGLDVRGYHGVNLAIHIASSMLTFGIVQSLFKTPLGSNDKTLPYRRPISFFVAVLFLVHPIQTQAVTYIWQRAASLAAFFYLASVFLYLKARLNGSRKIYARSLVMAVLGMFTKEITLSLPLAILAVELCFWRPDRDKKWKKLFFVLPYLALLPIIPLMLTRTDTITLPLMKPAVSRGLEPQNSSLKYLGKLTRFADSVSMPRETYLLTQINVFRTYCRLLVYPVNQNLDYDYPLVKSLKESQVFFSLVFLLTLIVFGITLSRQSPIAAFGLFWFMLTLSIESLVPQADVIFEHRLYLPSFGFITFLVMTLYSFFGKKYSRLIAILLMAAVAIGAFLTYERNKTWRDRITLWEDVVSKSPNKLRPVRSLGNVYKEMGRFEEAVDCYNRAIVIEPANALSYLNRANLLAIQGKSNEALADYDQAILLGPEFAEAYSNRGVFYLQAGNNEKAYADFQRGLQINPDLADLHSHLGIYYLYQGDNRRAISNFNRALALNNNLIKAYRSRAIAYYNQGNFEKSWADANQAQALGEPLSENFLDLLRRRSGRVENVP